MDQSVLNHFISVFAKHKLFTIGRLDCKWNFLLKLHNNPGTPKLPATKEEVYFLHVAGMNYTEKNNAIKQPFSIYVRIDRYCRVVTE